jgi:polyphosphate glucokinase
VNVLVIDVGGSNVKFAIPRKGRRLRFPSGKALTPRRMVSQIRALTRDWKYDVVSIGFPGAVIHGKPAADPPNLGKGWLCFDFEKAFKKPVKIMNDAAMQALGSYRGGRMLFVGLGTGVGSALILDDVIVPLELGDLSYSDNETLAQVVGKEGLKDKGRKEWEKTVHQVVRSLAAAFRTDYIIIGGGNVKKLKCLPACARRGSNGKAFIGGARLWGGASLHARARKHTWVIV